MRKYDVIIIGAGPAGLSAALSANRCGAKKIAVIDRLPELGGILLQCFHSGFGLRQYGTELTGVEYASKIVADVKNTDIEVFTDTAVIDLDCNRIITASLPLEGAVSYSGLRLP